MQVIKVCFNPKQKPAAERNALIILFHFCALERAKMKEKERSSMLPQAQSYENEMNHRMLFTEHWSVAKKSE